jgi:hypothetical protein
MGFFSIIETFFFISLGITIILVAMLVYHFKERLSSIEQKYDSLFDIVSDVVKQLSNIQSAAQPLPNISQFGGIYKQWVGQEHLGNTNVSTEYNNNNNNTFHTINDPDLYPYLPIQSEYVKNNDIIELEDDSETEFDDSDDESDDESETDIDDNVFSKVIVSDDEYTNAPNNIVDSVKIISLNVGENETNIEEIDITPINLEDNQDIDDIYESPIQDIQINYSDEQEDNSIIVKKIDDIQNESTDSSFVIERSTAKDLYKKMTLSNLKATVISKGLCSDPSKMKKNDLLKLLEDE